MAKVILENIPQRMKDLVGNLDRTHMFPKYQYGATVHTQLLFIYLLLCLDPYS